MTEPKPRSPIRRFDVFADYNRVKNQAGGMPEAQAKGRAVWIAKVVAGRRGGPPAVSETRPDGKGQKQGEGKEAQEEADGEFRSVGGVLQTDATFDKEIVDRMGHEFYSQIFHPAIEQAFKEGRRYEDIRDSIRKGWK